MSWLDCGVEETALVGHSFGELTALCVSGFRHGGLGKCVENDTREIKDNPRQSGYRCHVPPVSDDVVKKYLQVWHRSGSLR